MNGFLDEFFYIPNKIAQGHDGPTLRCTIWKRQKRDKIRWDINGNVSNFKWCKNMTEFILSLKKALLRIKKKKKLRDIV